jgi:protocatechuate 3,4-dioxygenase beta subunit
MRWIGTLLLLPLALAAQTKPGDSCSVSGQVSNAATGEPVRRAMVSLRRIDMSPGVTNIQITTDAAGQFSNTASTDAAGQFSISGIAPGKYRLSAERSGFINAQYGARGPNKPGTLLTLEPGQKSSDLSMRLTPQGVIAGRVLDEEGEPVANVDVQVLRQQYMQGRKQMARTGGASTNDLGEYRVFGLPPGRYYVSANFRQNGMQPQADDEYVTTFFPRTTDPAAAAPMDVAPGAQLRNIDIPLAKMHTVTVRGHVTAEVRSLAGGDTPQRPNLNVMLSARSTAIVGGGFARGAPVTPEGTFEFRSVTAGSYFLIGALNITGRALSARLPIEVGGSNLEGLSLTIRGGVPVTGRVRVEGETTASLAQVRLNLLPAEPGAIQFGPMPTQQLKEDGAFQMDDVATDRYMVSVNGLPEGFYVKSVRSANVDVTAQGLDVAGASPAALDVVLSPNAAQVTGTVLDPKTQKAAPMMMVVMVPQEKERRDRESFYRTSTTDLSGQFTFKSVPPGEYRVYSWEEVDYGAWMDPDFLKPLESRGEPVSLQESARPAIQVNLIPADSQ